MIDAKWFKKIDQLHRNPRIDSGVCNKKTQLLFINNHIENPHFLYGHINKKKLQEKEHQLLTLKKEINKDESNSTIKKLYNDYIDTLSKQKNLVLACADGEIAEFSQLSVELFGDATRPVWNDVVKKITGDRSRGNNQSADMAPPQELIPQVRNQIMTKYPGLKFLTNKAPHSNTVEADDIEKLLSKLLKACHISCEIILKETHRKFAYITQIPSIVVPKQYRSSNWQKAIQFCVHEIVGHLQRLEMSKKQNLGLLQFGLAGYMEAEEGIASMCAQAIADEVSDWAGLKQYYAIGLARGMDGIPRDFRQVYEILFPYFLSTAPENIKDKKAWAQSKAFHLCVRTFRGTDCKTKGVCYTRDIIYRTGNIKIWQLLKKQPEKLPLLFMGRYDPTNKEQCRALNKLGIAT